MERKNSFKVVVTVAVGIIMFMSFLSWITGLPCPIMKPITDFTHEWYTALPIMGGGAYVLWRFWHAKQAA